MIFTSHIDVRVDYDGTEIKEWDTKFDCPFIPGTFHGKSCMCWVIYKGLFGRWKIRGCYIVAVKFTNCWLLCMDNGWELFDKRIGNEIFMYDELDKAIHICEEKNRMSKVKIKQFTI